MPAIRRRFPKVEERVNDLVVLRVTVNLPSHEEIFRGADD